MTINHLNKRQNANKTAKKRDFVRHLCKLRDNNTERARTHTRRRARAHTPPRAKRAGGGGDQRSTARPVAYMDLLSHKISLIAAIALKDKNPDLLSHKISLIGR